MARYRRIDPYIWHDDKFPSFSDDAKLLFFHLLTTPRGNPLGCFVQGKADMAEYLGWSSKRLETPFRVLVSSDRIRYDEKTRLILIPRYLFYNPLENENQAKMACKYLSELPYNAQHFQGLKQSLEQYGKPFLILLVNALTDRINSGNGIGNGIGNGTPNTEPYPFLSEPQHLTVPPISPLPSFQSPEWLPSAVWKDYLDMRKSIKRPLSEKGQKLAIKKLDALRTGGHDVTAIIEQSIFHSWQGFFVVKEDGKAPSPTSTPSALSEHGRYMQKLINQQLKEQAAREASGSTVPSEEGGRA